MDNKKTPGLPLVVFIVTGVLAVGAVVLYGWIGLTRPSKANWWGMMGDSSGLFSALLNGGALLVALWTVHLQRREGHEAGEKTDRQLANMGDQLAEFAKSAAAQQKLAQSQQQLAEAQERANQEAAELRLAQHGQTIATLDAALASLKAAEAIAVTMNTKIRHEVKDAMVERRQSIGNRIAWELAAERRLLEKLGRPVPKPREETNG